MNIKDFKVGQTAYLMNFHGRLPNENTTTIDEVDVGSVGNKYVKVKYPGTRYDISFFQRDKNDSYFVEKVTCGTENYLFCTRQEINEYKERKELLRWICNKMQYTKENQYSVDQLYEIKRVLENLKN